MAEIARFFDTVLYTESDQAAVQNRLRREGVLSEGANRLGVAAPGGMFVSVNTGEAMVQGFHYTNTASLNLPIANNTSGSTRVDVVILRLDRVANTLVADIKQGTPGAGSPALTQIVGGTWEFPLASITIPTGTTAAITVGMIGDSRTWSRTVKFNIDVENGVINYEHLVDGAISNLLLNYKAIADLYNASTWTAATYHNLIAAQNFTVSVNARYLIISVQLGAYSVAGAAGWLGGTHVLIDGTTRYCIGGFATGATAGMGGCSGTIIIPAPAAGVHNVTPQIWLGAASTAYYLRSASQLGSEVLAVQVLEVRK